MERGSSGKNHEAYVPPTDEQRRREAVFALFDAVETGMPLPPAAVGYFRRNQRLMHSALGELKSRYPDQPDRRHYIQRVQAQVEATN